MANLPAPQNKEISDREIELLADRFADGETIGALARKLAGPDKNRRRSIRRKLARKVYREGRLRAELEEMAAATTIVGLVPAMEALTRRAARGRTDSIKLLAEITGFYNPRTTHEHTGEIKIKMEGMVRPPRVVDSTAEEVTDADVVS